MDGRCAKHQFEAAESACRACGNEFCGECLVYSFGPKKPPFCIACALTAAGVRTTAANRPVKPKKELKRETRARRKEAKASMRNRTANVEIEWSMAEDPTEGLTEEDLLLPSAPTDAPAPPAPPGLAMTAPDPTEPAGPIRGPDPVGDFKPTAAVAHQEPPQFLLHPGTPSDGPGAEVPPPPPPPAVASPDPTPTFDPAALDRQPTPPPASPPEPDPAVGTDVPPAPSRLDTFGLEPAAPQPSPPSPDPGSIPRTPPAPPRPEPAAPPAPRATPSPAPPTAPAAPARQPMFATPPPPGPADPPRRSPAPTPLLPRLAPHGPGAATPPAPPPAPGPTPGPATVAAAASRPPAPPPFGVTPPPPPPPPPRPGLGATSGPTPPSGPAPAAPPAPVPVDADHLFTADTPPAPPPPTSLPRLSDSPWDHVVGRHPLRVRDLLDDPDEPEGVADPQPTTRAARRASEPSFFAPVTPEQLGDDPWPTER